MNWVLILAVAVAGLVYVVAPLTRSGPRHADPNRGLAAELDARKRAALGGIVDLEDERAIGKLNHEDFHALRAEYEAEALVAMAELDQLDATDGDMEREIADLKARLADGDSI